MKHGFKAKAERIAEQMRKELNLTKFDPLDAFDLAAHLKIQIFSLADMKGDLVPAHFKTLTNTDKFSAMWLPNSAGQKVVVHNNRHSSKRQQSNLMHELSHIILQHSVPEVYARLCHELGLHYVNKEHEEEAKYLGGCLQITRAGLLEALKNNQSESKISDYFNASQDMVEYRIRITGVLKQLSYYR